MTPEQLKASILQYAIQGKLVEQRAEEGTAEEFYLKIKEEKETLIKEGKAKKGKMLSNIEDEEKPFDIPESWKWVYLQDISNINGGYAFKSTDYTSEGTRVIRISDFNETGFVNTKIVRHPYKEEFEPFLLAEKDVLLCMTGGTVGKSYFVQKVSERMMTNQRVATIKILGSIQEYVNYVILSPITQNIIQASKTSTNDNISMDTINSFLVPLPPPEEVARIVAKIEEILPFIDRYAEAYEKLEKFNAKFPEDMKKSILQYAIQGKLVEQRVEEGTAEELYQQIQEEKQELIAEKKIKKEKQLAEITEDEIPFDIPESWKWVRLGDCVSILGDGLHGTPTYSVDGEYFFINGNNLSNGNIEIKSDTKRVSYDEYEKYKKELNDNTVLVSINGTIGNVAFYSDEKVILGKSACYFNLIDKAWKEYIYWIIKTDYFLKYATTNATGSTIKNVSLATMKSFLIPLPPLEEQKRIVAKIEELLPFCDQLIK